MLDMTWYFVDFTAGSAAFTLWLLALTFWSAVLFLVKNSWMAREHSLSMTCSFGVCPLASSWAYILVKASIMAGVLRHFIEHNKIVFSL